MLSEITKLFDRDLQKLITETDAFSTEAHLWQTQGSIKNPAGNLALHLIGNLNHFVGRNLGGTQYVRNREAEFSTRNLPKAELVEQLAKTKITVLAALQTLQETDLQKTYTDLPFEGEMTTGHFLLHLWGHLNYHLGQINYLRRMQE